MTTIIGVDFSGHRDDRNTWLAWGILTDDGALVLDSVQPVRRDDLYHTLTNAPTPAVAALDFPFGVPRAFADFLSPKRPPRDMADIWQVVSDLTADDFIDRRDAFVNQQPGLPLSQREPQARRRPCPPPGKLFAPAHRQPQHAAHDLRGDQDAASMARRAAEPLARARRWNPPVHHRTGSLSWSSCRARS